MGLASDFDDATTGINEELTYLREANLQREGDSKGVEVRRIRGGVRFCIVGCGDLVTQSTWPFM
jgi:hypothetical protein